MEPSNASIEEKAGKEEAVAPPPPLVLPFEVPGVVKPAPMAGCIARITSNLKHLTKEPLEGIYVCPDEDRVDQCYALLIGPEDTPYENGFFYFHMDFPFDFPFNPPKVTFMTTGGGQVRFNPNLYADGKVCLSILGTWKGPAWSPAQSIGSLLLSIRSLLNEQPYHNEPGFETEQHENGCKNYNQIVRHETIRVAVLDMVDQAICDKTFPPGLGGTIRKLFLDNVELYKYYCDEFMFLDGREFQDPFGYNRGTFGFADLKERLKKMEEKLSNKTARW